MRLAVIGLASSHVDQLLRLSATGRLGPGRIAALLIPDEEPVDATRVESLHRAWGHPPLRTTDPARAVTEAGCTAALVTTRDPATHRTLAAPLLRAGIPVFVDKPFVGDSSDAATLVRMAARSAVPLTSSSALRWHPAARAVAVHRATAPGGPVLISGPADPRSPFGGRRFLGVHAVELALGALAAGGDRRPWVQSVSTCGDHREVDLRVGSDRALITWGAVDGWRLHGSGWAGPVELDGEYLRPGVCGFLDHLARGDVGRIVSGSDLIDAARVLDEACR